jgi:phosphate transport system substrate-binding protein
MWDQLNRWLRHDDEQFAVLHGDRCRPHRWRGAHGAGGTKDASLASKKISASCSSALQPLIKHAAAEFDTVQGTQSSIGAGGSGTGLTQISQGAVDLGMSDIFAQEKSGIDASALADHQVAAVAFTMIVNNDLQGKVGNLTTEQLTKIFTGEVSNWSEIGGPTEPITAVIRPAGSGTRATFKKYVLNNADDTAGTAVSQDNTGAVVAAVKATPGAIGYVASGLVTGDNKGDATPLCIDCVKAGGGADDGRLCLQGYPVLGLRPSPSSMLANWRLTSDVLVSGHRCSAGCRSGEEGGRKCRQRGQAPAGPGW